MGDRGHRAGGFGYMAMAVCPRCGFRRRLGRKAVAVGDLTCVDRGKCDARRQRGNLLNRQEQKP